MTMFSKRRVDDDCFLFSKRRVDKGDKSCRTGDKQKCDYIKYFK